MKINIFTAARAFRQKWGLVRPLLLVWIVAALGPAFAKAQSSELFRSWNQPIAPFKIMGNLYYVGASDIASYLIVTPRGHILVEGGFVETAPLIQTNITQFGFQLSDVKLLLTSHAHFDHAGGLAELKRLTGAQLVTTLPEALTLARGGKGDFHYGDALAFPPVTADLIIGDGEQVQLGGVALTARLTPGHTMGNVTWTLRVHEEGRDYEVVIMGSISAPGYQLVNNPNYPAIATDYERSFALLKTLPCEVFLAPHGFVFQMLEKKRRLDAGSATNPFIDPEGYRHAIIDAEREFHRRLNPSDVP